MGNALTAADIANLDRWQTVITPDLYYQGGFLMVRDAEALITSPVLQRHMRYHARMERTK